MKVKESKAAAREKRSQEQIDADNETNKKRMKAARENRSQEQKKADTDKDKESKAAAREDKRKKPDDRVGLEFIHDYHRSYDPLQYPLLFPDGQDGWHFDLHHTLLQHVNYITTYASKR